MRLTRGTFSYLPDFSDEDLTAQVRYAMDNGWAVAVEYTDDPNPRNIYWEMWDQPMFDLEDPADAIAAVNACREAYPDHYIALNAYSSTLHRQGIMLNIVVNRPPYEPGFRLDRQQTADRRIDYTIHSYAADRPHGERGHAHRQE